MSSFLLKRYMADDDSPDSLLLLSIRYIVENNVDFSDYCLPQEICNVMLDVYREKFGGFLADKQLLLNFLTKFKHSRITIGSLSSLPVTNEILAMFLTQQSKNLSVLDVDNCLHLTPNALTLINDLLTKENSDSHTRHVAELRSLIIGNSNQLLASNVSTKNPYLLHQNFSLQKLVINNSLFSDHPESPYHFITPALQTSLRYLDLSNCLVRNEILLTLTSLSTLILHNCPDINLKSLCQLKSLRHLDISTYNEDFGSGYHNPDDSLSLLVKSLPHLVHLDISGTNLAGRYGDTIIGLTSRYSDPLEFLGVYNTEDDAAGRRRLPALRVAGNATEEQIITACVSYIDRQEMLRLTLRDLLLSLQADFVDTKRALKIILLAMDHYLSDVYIQTLTSGSLYYIVRAEEVQRSLTSKVKRKVVTSLLNAMQAHKRDEMVLRNGFLTLAQFNIPDDMMFEIERLVRLLLPLICDEGDDFMQRLSTNFLKTLASRVSTEERMFIGDFGAVSSIISLISDRIEREICDDLMEIAWSTLWSLTDETSLNCERLVNNRGIEYFLQCLDTFEGEPSITLQYLMTGVLGNVAECRHLRYKMMKMNFIQKLEEMITSNSSVELRYNVCGILSHIVSDGVEVWNKHLPAIYRNSILNNMREAISKWKINARCFVTYRSFEPLLRLLKPNIVTYEAQYWSLWALTNQTRVFASKCCPLFIHENGVEIVNTLLSKGDLPDYVRDFCMLLLFQVERLVETIILRKSSSSSLTLRWQQNGTLGDIVDTDDIYVFRK